MGKKMENQTLDQIGIQYIEEGQFAKGKEYKGGDKTTLAKGFTKKYAQLFDPIRSQPIVLLELGVLHGRSVAMWSDYFANGQIHGLDVSLGPFNYNRATLLKLGAFKNNNVTLHEYDLKGTKFQEEFLKMDIQYDIIIDDANHEPRYQFDNFMLLFPKLKSGGYYIIEDIIKPVGFFDKFHEILEMVSNPDAKSSSNSRFGGIGRKIDSIEITNNMVIIKKV